MGGMFELANINILYRRFRGVAANVVQSIVLPILLINDLFEHIWQTSRNMFHRLRGDVRGFWDNVLPDDPRIMNNPIVGKENWKDRVVPIALHGDGASCTMKNNKL